MTESETLLDLARRFDQTDKTDFEAMIAMAVPIEDRLGDKRDDFEERYEAFTASNPQCVAPVETVLREMRLVQ